MTRTISTAGAPANHDVVSAATLLRLFDRRWTAWRRAFTRCRDEYSGRAVHGLRVQSRRLISVLGLIEVALPASPVGCVREVAMASVKSLSALRDTHVEIELASRWRKRVPQIRPLLRHLKRRERKLARHARRELKRAQLDGLEQAVESLHNYIERASGRGARQATTAANLFAAIERAFLGVVRLLGRVRTDELATIHRVRLAFKEFRYMAEGAAAISARVDRRCLQAMRSFQRRMGWIQDTVVLLERIKRFAALHPKTREAMGALRDAVLRRQSKLVLRFIKVAADIEQLRPLRRRRAAGTRNRKD